MSILERIKAANHQDRIARNNVRKGQTTAQKPVVKRITDATIPPKKTA